MLQLHIDFSLCCVCMWRLTWNIPLFLASDKVKRIEVFLSCLLTVSLPPAACVEKAKFCLPYWQKQFFCLFFCKIKHVNKRSRIWSKGTNLTSADWKQLQPLTVLKWANKHAMSFLLVLAACPFISFGM